MDSLGQALQSFNYALDAIGEPPRTPDQIKKFFGAGADRIFAQLVKDAGKSSEAFELYLNHQAELALKTDVFAGIETLLEKLFAAKVPMAIVTGRHARDLDVVLKPHRLDRFFSVLISDNLLPNSKPAPDGLLLAAQKMGLPPSQTFYVGDSPTDIQSAHNAGTVAIAALWDGLCRDDELLAQNPAFMAQTPADVWDFLASRI